MKPTPELLAQIKSAQSAEELKSLVQKSGVLLTKNEADSFFAALHKEGEIAEEELGNVAGGWCMPDDVQISNSKPICPDCGSPLEFKTNVLPTNYGVPGGFLTDDYGRYDLFECSGCGQKYRHHFEGSRWTED